MTNQTHALICARVNPSLMLFATLRGSSIVQVLPVTNSDCQTFFPQLRAIGNGSDGLLLPYRCPATISTWGRVARSAYMLLMKPSTLLQSDISGAIIFMDMLFADRVGRRLFASKFLYLIGGHS